MHNFFKAFRYTSIFLLLTSFILICPSGAGADNKTVVTKGVAAIQGENREGARAAALENALRNAVEQGLGTMMDAKSIVRNDRLLEQIYTHTKGFISEYEILKEERTDNSLYRVTLSAVVRTGRLKDRLARLGIIKQMMGYPRIAIVAKAVAAGVNEEAVRSAGLTLAGFFTDRHFDVVDGSSANVSFQSAEKNRRNPAEFGRAKHADVVVVYGLSSEPSRFDGVMETVPVSVSARAVVTSTDQVLSSEQIRDYGLGNSSHAALMDGTRKSSDRLASALSEDIVGWWEEYTVNGLPYRIVLKTPSGGAGKIVEFQQKVRSIPGVATLTERSSGKGVTEMHLTFKGRIAELKRQILGAVPGIDDNSIITDGRYMEVSCK